MEYLRNVEHCEVSPYVKMVTIKSVEPALNSDNLEKITFHEIGWNAISQKGLHFAGKMVMFIPPDSVLPTELCELLGVTQYTSKGRIRVTSLRGNRSEGLIVDFEKVEPYIPYIMKWEDPPSIEFAGKAIRRSDIPIDFVGFYKMPNILNEPTIFEIGEEIWYSEKLHGTNMRFGFFKNPVTEQYEYYVGSHNIVLQNEEGGNNLYWNVFKEFFEGRIPKDLEFFCEPFGANVQHLGYGRAKPDVCIFAIAKRGMYLPIEEVIDICDAYELPVVNFKRMMFTDIESIRALADEASEYTDKHYREGIVMVSAKYPEKMAKCIGFTYWTNNQGKQKAKRTERH